MIRVQTMHAGQGVKRLLRLLVLVSCLIGMQHPVEAADPSFSGIPILASGSGEIEAELVADEADGFICTAVPDLVRMFVDGKQVFCNVQPLSSDRAMVTASFSGLEDGKHLAEAETLGFGGETLSRKQTVFIVDTQPPELELITPESRQILPTQTTFQVLCSDRESGISTDSEASGLSVTINGREAVWRWDEEDGEKILSIAFPVSQWDPGQTVALHVHVQDRAGNPAEWNGSFEVETSEEEWEIETVNCVEGDGTMDALYVLRRIPFPLQTSVHWLSFDAANLSCTLPMALSTLQGRPLDRAVYNALEVASNHPCIRVDRLSRSPEAKEIAFRIRQVSLPEGDDCLGSITVEYPEFVVFDYELSCTEGAPDAVVLTMHTEGDMKTFTIPVSLHAEMHYSEEVRVEDGLLRYQFLLTGPGSLDTAASWFEMEGTKKGLTRASSDRYETSVPVNEGLHVYTTQLSLGLWGWGSVAQGMVSEDGHALLKNGEVFVTLDPPQIEHFHYDLKDECFRAVVSDQGTALEDLVLELIASGNDTQEPAFDPGTGDLMSSYPLPEGVQAALLKVTDLAGQTTTATCRVFGSTPEALTVQDQDPVYPVTTKEGGQSLSRKPSTSPSNWRFNREYLPSYRNGKQAVTECMRTTLPVTKEGPLTRCLKRAWALYGNTQVSADESESSLKATGTLPALNPALERAEEACKAKYPPGMMYHWEYEPTVECWNTWVDTLPPRIRDLTFLPSTRQVTALIDDHGMPLSQVQVSYCVAPEPLIQPNYYPSRPFSFDTGTGLFLADRSVPQETEVFKVEIQATDAAGNWSEKWLDVKAPVRPPDVSLDILEKGVASYPVGTCSDSSGIDHRKTRAWLDEQPVSPFGIQYNHPASPDRVDFTPVTDEGPHRLRLEVTDFAGLSSEASAAFQVDIPPVIQNFRHHPESIQHAGSPSFSAVIHDNGADLDLRGIEMAVDGDPLDRQRFFYDPSSGYFASDGPLELGSGMHEARLTATDAHGHSDEAVLRFSQGEPVGVPEKGPGDLSIEEVTLWEIEGHNGDGRANPGETVRLFVSLTQQGAEVLVNVLGRLESEEPGIVVEKDQVAYGTLHPGDTVSPLQGFDIRIDEDFLDTRPSDPYEARFTLEATAGGGKTWLLDLDLLVYQPTLPFSIVSPEDQDAGTNPLVSEVTVTLDPLPPTTEQEEIDVTGSAASSASTIDEVVVRINGIEHEADWNPGDGTFSVTVALELGDNVIEAEAMDRTGASGMDTGFVYRTDPFVPPEIVIQEPTDGEVFPFCVEVHLNGQFDAGSSEVALIQGSMSGEGETVSIPIDYSGDGAFLVAGPLNAYFLSNWGHNHETTITATVILTTMDGDTVQDTVTFTYSCYM